MVGKKILHYQLIDRIGAGGMGEIYKAQDSRLNRLVAVKILSPGMASDAERRRRFFQEAQAASALNHPNIITLYDIVSEDDLQCIVMEYIAGKTLRDLIPADGLPTPQAIQYATQIASALTAAHAENIIHRDLKPSNIMVNASGLIKVLDFGLAKWVDPGISSHTGESTVEAALTREGSIIGTVSYMSPEQAEGKRVDGRSDIFSFGSVLYEMVTGKRAFEGRSGISTLSSILRDDVTPIYEAAPDVPPVLEQIVLRCLVKDPGSRWQSMKEIESALGALQRQVDPEGRYASPLPSSPLPPLSAPAALYADPPTVLFARTPAAVASESPRPISAIESPAPPQVPVPPNGPSKTGGSNGPPKGRVDVASPPTDVRQRKPSSTRPAAPGGRQTSRRLVLAILALIGAVLVAGAGVGGWYWWKSHQSQIAAATRQTPPVVAVAPVTPPPVQPSPAPESPAAAAPAPAADTTTPKASTPKRKPKVEKATLPPIPAPIEPPPAPAPTATPIPPVPNSIAHPVVQTTPVMVADALPFEINLSENVPAEAPEGQPLHFVVTSGLQVGDKTVVAKGAAVSGTVTGETGKKKFLGMGGGRKLTFLLTQVEAVDGRKLAVRALAGKSEDGPTTRPFETVKNSSKNKGFAAMQGTVYIAYIDGDQIVTVHK